MERVLPNVTGVAINGRALLIAGSPGCGKSSLALALIDRGAVLVGDDAVNIRSEGSRLMALPPPEIVGKLEIRGVGIVDLPTSTAPVALLLDLENDPARMPDELAHRHIEGIAIPELAFAAGDAVQAIRAEYALARYGLIFDD